MQHLPTIRYDGPTFQAGIIRVYARPYHGRTTALDRCIPLTTTVADTTLYSCRLMLAQLSFLCAELNIRSITYQSFIHYGRRME